MAHTGRRGRAGAAVTVTSAQYREAERALRLMLARKFSAAWIVTNYRELLSIANTEYIKWAAKNGPADNPVGWIVHNAMWRAQNILDSEDRHPTPAPLDSVFHLADDESPQPEDVAIEHDRERRMADALSHLSDKERRLVVLVYFEEMSIREAGDALGWSKSSADRHHAAAMARLHALVGDREMWERAGPFAVLAMLLRRVNEAISGARATIERRAAASGRLGGLAESSGALTNGGAGRLLAQCGAAAAVAVCAVIAAPGVEHGVRDVLDQPAPKEKTPRSRPTRSLPGRTLEGVEPSPRTVTPEPSEPTPSTARTTRRPKAAKGRRRSSRDRVDLGSGRRAPRAKTNSDAGAEGQSEVEATPPVEEFSEPEVAPEPEAVAPEPAPPASGSQVGKEFGL